MKLIVVFSLLCFSLSTFAGEVLTCNLGKQEVYKIMKDRDAYFYNLNGRKYLPLATAQTLQKNAAMKNSFLKELMTYTDVPLEELSRVNVYSLVRDDDGGRTIVRFIFNDDTYVAVYVSMGRLAPCL